MVVYRQRQRQRTAGTVVKRAYRTSYKADGELKFHDVSLDDAVVANAGTITATINIIPQGVTEVQRIGRKATIKKIGWKYQITLPEKDAVSTPNPGDVCRVILYLDKQANGAAAAVTDLLESASHLSFNNLVNTARFRVRMDRTHTLNYASMASDGAGVVSQADVLISETFYKSCNIPLEFSAGTGAITEIRSNNLGVLLISKNDVLDFRSKFRLRFTD